MPFDTLTSPLHPPVNAELVDRIVSKLKSQGIFDQFRKDCLADVDTKPAYQNLQQRVNGTVATFLATQQWRPDLNKIQLRESLRRHVQQGFLEIGVDRIVDQVVNPKIVPVFMPKVEDVVCECMGIEKPKQPLSTTFSSHFFTAFPPPSIIRPNTSPPQATSVSDLLPKDLDPVSPESDTAGVNGGSTPVKDELNNIPPSPKMCEEHESQLSGISELSSHVGDSFQDNLVDSNTVKSVVSPKVESHDLQFDNFTNLSEKIKQAEKTHGLVGGSQYNPSIEEPSSFNDSLSCILPKEVKEDTLSEEVKGETISTNSLSTLDDSKAFVSDLPGKDETPSNPTFSEDSISSSHFTKVQSEPSSSKPITNSEVIDMSLDDQDEHSLLKDSLTQIADMAIKGDCDVENLSTKSNDLSLSKKLSESVDTKKSDDRGNERRSRDSSSSSKHRHSDSTHRHSDSKHQLGQERKSDEKSQDKNKENHRTSSKDEKSRSTHRNDKYKPSHSGRHSSSYKNDKKDPVDDKIKEEKEQFSKNEDKANIKEDKTYSYGDKERSESRDKSKDTEKSVEKMADDKSGKYGKTYSRRGPDKEGSSKNKESVSRSKSDMKEKSDSVKDKETAHHKEKEKKIFDREKTYSSKEVKVHSSQHRSSSDKERYDRDRSERGRGDSKVYKKSGKDHRSSSKDKHHSGREKSNYENSEKYKDSKKEESKEEDKSSRPSSKILDDSENDKKQSSRVSSSSNSNVERRSGEKKDRKRKSERCNDGEIKSKDPRRSSDRDNGGSKGTSNHSFNSETRHSSSVKSSSSDKKTISSSSSENNSSQEQTDQPPDAIDVRKESSDDVDLILLKLNSSIQALENAEKHKISPSSFQNEGSLQTEHLSADDIENRSVDKNTSKASEVDDIISKLNSSIEKEEVEEIPVKKPKIAKNFSEIRKIMLARKNIDRRNKIDKRNEFPAESIKGTTSPDKESFEESKNLNSDIIDQVNTFFFLGFSDTETEKTVNNFLIFQKTVGYHRMFDVTERIIKHYSQKSTNNEFFDNNLNKVHSEIQSTDASGNQLPVKLLPRECYVRLDQDCPEVLKHLQMLNQSKESLVEGEERRKSQLNREGKAHSTTSECPGEAFQKSSETRFAEESDPCRGRNSTEESQNPSDVKIEQYSPESPIPENCSQESHVSDEDKLLSVSLTEDMLNNLMKESMCAEIDGLDSSCVAENEKSSLGTCLPNEQGKTVSNVLNESATRKRKIDSGSNTFGLRSSNELLSNCCEQDEENRREIANCITPKKGNEDQVDASKVRSKRLSRSSQRYSSSDLYKPRPVLTQYSKRFRAARSDSSGQVSSTGTRDSCDSTVKKKR